MLTDKEIRVCRSRFHMREEAIEWIRDTPPAVILAAHVDLFPYPDSAGEDLRLAIGLGRDTYLAMFHRVILPGPGIVVRGDQLDHPQLRDARAAGDGLAASCPVIAVGPIVSIQLDVCDVDLFQWSTGRPRMRFPDVGDRRWDLTITRRQVALAAADAFRVALPVVRWPESSGATISP